MRCILPLILLIAGCESVQYRGISPNARTFSDDPQLDQYYVGLDFEFNVVDPSDTNPPGEKSSTPYFPPDPNVIPRPVPEPNIPW
jgi:hypothetical protein